MAGLNITGLVVIEAVNPPGPRVTAISGEVTAIPASAGGWKFEPRPRRAGFTTYKGVDPYTLTVQLLFDGFADDRSVEGELETLRGIYRNRVGPRAEPAVVKITGATIHLTWLDWVIADIATGKEDRRDDGARVRSWQTVTFMQYLAADLLVGPASAAQGAQEQSSAVSAYLHALADASTYLHAVANAKGGGAPAAASSKTYAVRSGDTLSSIAARSLGDFNRWREIASLNNIRDPNSISVGQTLRLP